MKIEFPCPTCGRPMTQGRIGELSCWHGCGGHYALNDLLRGLFKWNYDGDEPVAKIGDIGHAKLSGLGRGWGWTARIGTVRLTATHQGGNCEHECEREVIAYLRGKLAEGDTQ